MKHNRYYQMKILMKLYWMMKLKIQANFEKVEKNINDMLDRMIMVDYKERYQLVLWKKTIFLVLFSIFLGTLAPSFKLNSQSSIDLIFATYWIQSDTSTLLHADERACIDEGMAKEEDRLKSTNGKWNNYLYFLYFEYILY